MNRRFNTTRGNFQKYQSRNPLQQFLIRRFLKKIRGLVKELPAGSICDAGCGEGFVLKDLLAHGLCREQCLTGLDLDCEALTFASAQVVGVPFICASVFAIPFEEKKFQGLLLLEVLEHLQDPKAALKEAARVSRFLLVSVPHEPLFQVANLLRGKNLVRWGDDFEHVQHWGKKSFRELLSPYGEILRLETSFPWLIALVEAYPASEMPSESS